MYDTNNRLITFNGNTVSYDMDGNMLSARLSGTNTAFEYDSSNRLIKAGDHTYTYNAEDVRIRNVRDGYDTTYTYNTNARLSQLLVKTTNGITTKYVYGLGLIGEEKECCFKTYHFDYRGSTVAITDECGNITDTFKYDTYGKLISRTGNSFVILGYNGRDGVVTDKNGLLYMRARYYSPDMRRFVNADILHGDIFDPATLNRYAYVNGNPVSFVDPFGLAAEERGMWTTASIQIANSSNWFDKATKKVGNWFIKLFNASYSSIEAEAGLGYGLGFSGNVASLDLEVEAYSDVYTIRQDDGEIFFVNSGEASIGVGAVDWDKASLKFGGSYRHDYRDRAYTCTKHHAFSNPFEVATCEDAEKEPFGLSVPILGNIETDSSGDIVINFVGGGGHLILGGHYSVGINISQFFREMSE